MGLGTKLSGCGAFGTSLVPSGSRCAHLAYEGLDLVSCFQKFSTSGGLAMGSLDSQRDLPGVSELTSHSRKLEIFALFAPSWPASLGPAAPALPSLVLRFPAYCLFRDCNFLPGMRPGQRGLEVYHRPHVNFPFQGSVMTVCRPSHVSSPRHGPVSTSIRPHWGLGVA